VLLPVLQRRFHDPGLALGPVIAALGDEPHALVLPDDEHPLAVELDFVKPVRSRRNLLAGSWHAQFIRNTHGPKIGSRAENANLAASGPRPVWAGGWRPVPGPLVTVRQVVAQPPNHEVLGGAAQVQMRIL
jgi:hypothetical protein